MKGITLCHTEKAGNETGFKDAFLGSKPVAGGGFSSVQPSGSSIALSAWENTILKRPRQARHIAYKTYYTYTKFWSKNLK